MFDWGTPRRIAFACLLLAALTACKERPTFSQPAQAQSAPGVAQVPLESGAAGAASEVPAPGPPAPDAALSCYVTAQDHLHMNDRTALLLCRGAISAAPAQCYQTARDRTRLLDFQIVTLCRCASSTAPVACFERGQKTTFLIDDQLLLLCSATNSQQVRGNCVPYG